MSDLRGQQIKNQYQNLLTKGSGNTIEDGDGVALEMIALSGVDLLETGSNENGSYVRFAGGFQVCWQHRFVNESVGPGSSINRTWTYPKSFSEVPYSNARAGTTSASASETANIQTWHRDGGDPVLPTATAVEFRFNNDASGSRTIRASVVAVGFWS